MGTTPTTNYGFLKPTDMDDDDAWGVHLNTTLDSIDAEIKNREDEIDNVQAVMDARMMPTIVNDVSAAGGNLNYDVATIGTFILGEYTTAQRTITLTSTLPAGRAIHWSMEILISSGGALLFAAGTGVTLRTNLDANPLVASGRHIIELYAYKKATGNTIVLLKQIGSVTGI